MRALFHICPNIDLIEPPDNDDQFTNNSIYEIINDMAQSIKDITFKCNWKEKLYKTCSDILKPIFTDDGLCFAFNALNSNETYTEQ